MRDRIYYERGKPVGVEWRTPREMTTGEFIVVAAVCIGVVLGIGLWLSKK